MVGANTDWKTNLLNFGWQIQEHLSAGIEDDPEQQDACIGVSSYSDGDVDVADC